MAFRYYDAGAGRFVNRDPLGYGGGINLYNYCANNPINRLDPSGLDFGSWYMGGMGGFSCWVDKWIMGGATSNLGTVQGCYDAGHASGWQLAAAYAEWGAMAYLAAEGGLSAGKAGMGLAGMAWAPVNQRAMSRQGIPNHQD